MAQEQQFSHAVLIALRRIVHAIDLHSKKLGQEHGVTGPQMVVLSLLAEDSLSVGELARQASLSQATITDILDRLARRGLIERMRSATDKRRVLVSTTPAARRILATSPPLLQDSFVQAFGQLPDWEQTNIVATLQRVAAMMNAPTISAAPVLCSDPLDELSDLTDATPLISANDRDVDITTPTSSAHKPVDKKSA